MKTKQTIVIVILVLTNNSKLCWPNTAWIAFATWVRPFVRFLYVMYGENTSGAVECFHKSVIKQFLVSTTMVEYVPIRIATNCFVFPIDIRWLVWCLVWCAAKIHRRPTEWRSILWTVHYCRWCVYRQQCRYQQHFMCLSYSTFKFYRE